MREKKNEWYVSNNFFLYKNPPFLGFVVTEYVANVVVLYKYWMWPEYVCVVATLENVRNFETRIWIF